MQDHPVLGQVALGYSPMIDRQHQVVATRLTVFPERPDAAVDAGGLLRALDEVWPLPEAGAAAAPALVLNPAGEALLESLLAQPAQPHRMIEVPAFLAAEPARAARLVALKQDGAVLLLKGRPLAPLPPELLACFANAIVDFGDDWRATPGSPGPVCLGARTQADAAAAFGRGAGALLGWTFDDPPPAPGARNTVPPDLKVVLDLVNGVDRDEPAPKLEATLKRDPTLAFRLMRYLNSPAFGLSVEINSFGHALMLLGRQRLKRWLVLLLASSSKDASARPLMHAAVRRGLILEELVRPQGDAEVSGEMFICGVFSLLDRLLQQPMEMLLSSVPVPERVQLALRGDGGPHQPFLDLVRAIEAEAVFDIRECAERVFLGPMEINRALLTALRAARQLD
jgi:EAL and modified HD-GYP domain-containing signal transduction protein